MRRFIPFCASTCTARDLSLLFVSHWGHFRPLPFYSPSPHARQAMWLCGAAVHSFAQPSANHSAPLTLILRLGAMESEGKARGAAGQVQERASPRDAASAGLAPSAVHSHLRSHPPWTFSKYDTGKTPHKALLFQEQSPFLQHSWRWPHDIPT